MRLIDADKLTTETKGIYCEDCDDDICDLCWVADYIEYLKNAPTVEAEPVKHGRWKVIDRDVQGQYKYQCSECGSTKWAFVSSDYCEGCGAKMG